MQPDPFGGCSGSFSPFPLLFSFSLSPPLRPDPEGEGDRGQRRSSVATPKSSDLIEAPCPYSLKPNPRRPIGRPAHAKVRFFPPPSRSPLLEPRAPAPRIGDERHPPDPNQRVCAISSRCLSALVSFQFRVFFVRGLGKSCLVSPIDGVPSCVWEARAHESEEEYSVFGEINVSIVVCSRIFRFPV